MCRRSVSFVDEEHAALQAEARIERAAGRRLAAPEGRDLVDQLLVAAAQRRRLHVIAGLRCGLDADGVHHRHHQRDRVFRPRHDGERLEAE